MQEVAKKGKEGAGTKYEFTVLRTELNWTEQCNDAA